MSYFSINNLPNECQETDLNNFELHQIKATKLKNTVSGM